MISRLPGDGRDCLDFATIFGFLAALFAVMNPIGAAPLFLSMTPDNSAAERAAMARTAALTATAILIVTVFAGRPILSFFGITIDSFRVAGGLIVLLMSISMLRAQASQIRGTAEEEEEGVAKDNPAVFPLAIPLLTGPGAISTTILWSGQTTSWMGLAGLCAVIVLLGVVVFAILRGASIVSRVMGVTGMNVMTRIMGLILASIAIEMIAAGLKVLLPHLAIAGA